MPQNFNRRQGCIPGYWGRDPHRRLVLERTPDKIRTLLEEQLRTNGRPVWLWLPVLEASTGTVHCTCEKDTTQTSDFKCLTCFGMKYAPGYRKFLHETIFFASAEFAGFTLTGVEIDRRIKPNRLRLTSGSTSGTIVTPDKAYANPGDDDWSIELAAYRKQAGDTVALEYSADAGASWTAVALTGGPLFGYRGAIAGSVLGGSGTVRFRVTLGRTDGASPESPSFEIVRALHVRSEDVNPILRQRDEYLDGQILILRTWDQELVAREVAVGRTIQALGDRGMTAPLDFFDLTITQDTVPAAFDDREPGPHPLFEYSSGVRAAQRYAMYAINIDSTIDNVMSHQSFSERRIQEGELYSLVY